MPTYRRKGEKVTVTGPLAPKPKPVPKPVPPKKLQVAAGGLPPPRGPIPGKYPKPKAKIQRKPGGLPPPRGPIPGKYPKPTGGAVMPPRPPIPGPGRELHKIQVPPHITGNARALYMQAAQRYASGEMSFADFSKVMDTIGGFGQPAPRTPRPTRPYR